MNINENLVMDKNDLRKITGCKITNVAPAIYSSVSNIVPIQCLDIVLLQ